MVAPKLNRRRALFVLAKIDEILSWEKSMERERDIRFVDLGRFLCEVRSGQYWRLDNLKSFDEFLEKRFPGSRRKAYYLMTIHEQLPRIPKLHLKQVGWSKATELAKVARRDGQQFDCATWLHRAQELPKDEFKRQVERHLTGKETEPWEILYFKVYKSQLSVIEQALETTALMLGTDKSRGYCLEMICADFLAGANLENNNPKALLFSLNRLAAGPFHQSQLTTASSPQPWLNRAEQEGSGERARDRRCECDLLARADLAGLDPSELPGDHAEQRKDHQEDSQQQRSAHAHPEERHRQELDVAAAECPERIKHQADNKDHHRQGQVQRHLAPAPRQRGMQQIKQDQKQNQRIADGEMLKVEQRGMDQSHGGDNDNQIGEN